jgi:hypothetical protein
VAGALGIGFVAPLDDALESGLLHARVDRSPTAVIRTNGFMRGRYACRSQDLPLSTRYRRRGQERTQKTFEAAERFFLESGFRILRPGEAASETWRVRQTWVMAV